MHRKTSIALSFAGLLLLLGLWSMCATSPLRNKIALAHKGIELAGSLSFVDQIRGALNLLSEKSPEALTNIQQYIDRIEEGDQSGMYARKRIPTLVLTQKTAMYSLTWCAGTIVHDACHSQLYHEYRDAHGLPVPNDAWTGQQREMECIAHQLSIMRQIGAQQHEIDYLMSLDGTHHDINQDGVFTWEDYPGRDW